MKTIKLLLTVFVAFFLFNACQKELSFESGNTNVPGDTAVYALIGSGGACSNANVQGNYTIGTPLTPNNTVVLQVNVTTPGTYTITTVPVNGITFTGSGSFGAAGAATITLTGSGTPANAGQITIPVVAGISACTFPVTVMPQGGGSAAVYTLAGSPGPCANANVQGAYTAGTALTAANNVTIEVNVSTAGSYTITSVPVNGMTFSRSGTFTTTGSQTVELQGTGTPTTAGNHQFPIVAGTSGCAFTVSVNPVSGGGGTTAPDSAWSFNEGSSFFFGPIDTAYLTTTGIGTVLIIEGHTYHTSDTLIGLQVLLQGSTIQPGTYSTSSNARFDFVCNCANPVGYYGSEPSTTNAIMSVVITSYNSTTRVVQGTFSGNAQTPAGALVPITNGKFRATVGQ